MDANRIKEELIRQKHTKFKGNIYHWTQVNFAYNSNKIEGSRLTEEQTEMIYETHSFIANEDESVHVDDLIETINHFKLFDYMLDHIDQPLTKEIIIEMNTLLKTSTTHQSNPLYNVGGFKKVPNVIGMVESVKTSAPENVESDIEDLLSEYLSKQEISIDDIISFHVRFEQIHPFSDGNGRVGRMIMFKECLKNNIIPFVILDSDKLFYMRGLKEFPKQPQYLIDTCLLQQDRYESICKQLLDYNL